MHYFIFFKNEARIPSYVVLGVSYKWARAVVVRLEDFSPVTLRSVQLIVELQDYLLRHLGRTNSRLEYCLLL